MNVQEGGESNDLLGSNPFTMGDEEEVIRKPISKRATLKLNVETIITSQEIKEKEEQVQLITQILEIEDFIMKNNNIIGFRKILKKQIALFTIFILFIIAERVLYTSLIDEEEELMKIAQLKIGVVKIVQDNHYYQFINSTFFKIMTFGFGFHHSMLLMTHFFVTIFVSISDFIGIKLIFTTLLGLYFIGVLQLFYDGPLPYWVSEKISSPTCVTTSSHPSRPIFTVLYITFYFFYCLKFRISRQQNMPENQKKHLYRKIKILQIFTAIFFLPYFFLFYISGLAFIINIGLAFIMFFFYYTVISQSNHYVSELIAKISINTEDAKRNIFRYFIYLVVMIIFAQVVYLSANNFVDLQWIGNYLNCTKESSTQFLNDQLVGPYHTFSVVSVLGGVAGAIFGLNNTYNHLSQQCIKIWYKGTILKRCLRGLIANIFMIPSWILCIYQDDLLKNDFFVNLGFTEFLMDVLHYFFLYLFLFGFVPVYIFQNLKLVHFKKQKKTDRSITILNPSFLH